ncbi:hypothetical protein [Thalassospira xiamenensis]|uniref:Lipoprotein n=1 Tax=Thalassospira xiamenensis TaxID=220697 RepID=A0ABR5XWI0_9PROT|nr:hypothetical protein [Thalassospira xiamenensis]KZC97158.1 hypothetical protein AUP40_04270 [Thalassospira xiamenensis]KZD10249.1 hypothetical protein AUP45_02940 [Thalassospira xiamenensis]MCD1593101.1 hypothetical protein [Thalassospira xiamenensis]
MKKYFGIAMFAVLFLLPSHPTFAAQPVCVDRDRVIAHLGAQYGEVPVAEGITANGGVLEVLASPDGESWSILFTYPAGATCVLASGEAWQHIAPVPASRGDPGDPA